MSWTTPATGQPEATSVESQAKPQALLEGQIKSGKPFHSEEHFAAFQELARLPRDERRGLKETSPKLAFLLEQKELLINPGSKEVVLEYLNRELGELLAHERVVEQLEAGELSPVSLADPRTDLQLTFEEAQTLHWLNTHDRDLSRRMQAALKQRNPNDIRLANHITRKLSFDKQHFSGHVKTTKLELEGLALLEDLKIRPPLVKEFHLTDRERESYLALRSSEPDKAKELAKHLGKRDNGVLWGLATCPRIRVSEMEKHWDNLKSLVLSEKPFASIKPAEARNLLRLAVLSDRSTKVFEQIAGRGHHDLAWGLHRMVREHPLIKVDQTYLGRLRKDWQILQDAKELARSDEPLPARPGAEFPLSFEETRAYVALARERRQFGGFGYDGQEHAKKLAASFQARDGRSEVFLTNFENIRKIDEESFEDLCHRQERKEAAKKILSGQPTDTGALSSDQMSALFYLRQVGLRDEWKQIEQNLATQSPKIRAQASLVTRGLKPDLQMPRQLDPAQTRSMQAELESLEPHLAVYHQVLEGQPQSADSGLPYTPEEVQAWSRLRRVNESLAQELQVALKKRSPFIGAFNKDFEFAGGPELLGRLHRGWQQGVSSGDLTALSRNYEFLTPSQKSLPLDAIISLCRLDLESIAKEANEWGEQLLQDADDFDLEFEEDLMVIGDHYLSTN